MPRSGFTRSLRTSCIIGRFRGVAGDVRVSDSGVDKPGVACNTEGVAQLRQTWGDNVLAARQAARLSQNELAREAGGSTDPSNISKIERGLVGVSDEMKTRLARALGEDVSVLFPFGKTNTKEG